MKCLNCGKEVKEGLKFCTNCGKELVNKEVEIISNEEEEGKDVANDKTALIAILLTILFGAFVVVVGISSINRYKCTTDCDIEVVDPEPVEEEKDEVEFGYNSSFELYGNEYKFKDVLISFTDSGFEIDDTVEYSNSEEEVILNKNDQELYLHVFNDSSKSLPRGEYTVKELEFIYSGAKYKYVKVFELPEEVTLFDSYNSVIEKYGDYDYKNDNCYVYNYEDLTGRLELCFKNSQLNGFKIINEVK